MKADRNSNEWKQGSRRRFLRSATLAGASLALGDFAKAADKKAAMPNPICVFNKPLQHLDYAAQADLVAEMGFVGIEGTVRKGGHVEPARVEQDLPLQVEALKSAGVEMTLMTTDINNVESELHRRVLKTAASLGVKRFRMGSIKLDYGRSITEQIDEIRGIFQDLVAYCDALGIQPLYQNHAGANRFGAGIWDLHAVLQDIDPAQAGIAFDIRHATVEGGQSWPTEFQLMRPHFGVVYCKDFIWETGSSKPRNVPLGSGRVDYPKFLAMLRKSDYRGPISLHMEYKDHRDPKLLKESIAAIRADRKALLEMMAATA